MAQSVMTSDGYTAEMAHAAVAEGAAWLDQKCPDWFREIKVERLDMSSKTFCVLGQTAHCLLKTGTKNRAMRYGFDAVFESFEEAWVGGWGAAHGFDTPRLISPGEESAAAFEMLAIAWREYIRQRLEVAA